MSACLAHQPVHLVPDITDDFSLQHLLSDQALISLDELPFSLDMEGREDPSSSSSSSSSPTLPSGSATNAVSPSKAEILTDVAGLTSNAEISVDVAGSTPGLPNAGKERSHTHGLSNAGKERSRKRASKPKVRTGCITCKQRRVKCDEAHPVCSRCTKAGIVCQGYVTKKVQPDRTARLIAPRIRTVADLAIAPRPSFALNPFHPGIGSSQTRSFDYFRLKTASEMSHLFESKRFWENFVPRMCREEPSIYDAAVALGMLHEMHALNPNLRARNDPNDATSALVLNQYNRAIEGVNKRISNSSFKASEIALVSCLLFLGIDILLARFDAATKHVQNGLRIVQEWKPHEIILYDNNNNLQDNESANALTHVKDLAEEYGTDEEQLAIQFARLNFNVAFISVDSRRRPRDVPMPAIFKSLLQARIHLSMTGELLVGWTRSIGGTAESINPSNATRARQVHFKNKLKQWKISLDNSTHLNDAKLAQPNAVLTMLIHHLGMSAMVDSAVSDAREMTLDLHEANFRQMVNMAQEVVDREESSGGLPTLCYDVGIVYPLFSVAMKCRNPFIRRQAISILESHPRREGTMDSLSAAKFAHKIMQMEEAGFEGLSDAQQLPEYARFHQSLMVPDNDEGSGGFMICKKRRHDVGDWITIRHPYSLLG